MSNKPNYKTSRKYKCPYCDRKDSRVNLVDHVEKAHQELIPEGYTAARAIFDSINGKDHGICMICKKPIYKWNDKINRYYNLCDDPKCRAKVREIALARHMKVYNKPTLLNDPEQQEKMLANRRISGSYVFSDGTKMTYTGKYERNALEFMDKVLNIPAKDIQAPGPVLEYDYNGEKHKWITDIYYIPGNLLIEIKDGGSNPNNRTMTSYREKQNAKEVMITNLGKFNYIRLTDNNFAQLLDIFADMKEEALNNNKDHKVKIHINESKIISDKDIYYNKDKFDSGEINLCFITGHSGSGKSTMGRNMQSDNIEHYEMDDIMTNFNFSDSNLKEYGDLIYSYFKGPGKKFRYHSKDEYMNDKSYANTDEYTNGYEALNAKSFVNYAIKYAKSHKNIKYVLDGIWIYLFINPELLKDCAVYIKGTSAIKSAYRASKRDIYDGNIINYAKGVAKKFLNRITMKQYWSDEKRLNNFKNYFKKLILNEEVGGLPPQKPAEAYIVPYGMNNVFDGYAYSDNTMNDTILTTDEDDNILPMVESEFYDKYETGPMLFYKDPDIEEKIADIHNDIRNKDKKFNKNYFAEKFLGYKIYNPEEVIISESFKYFDIKKEDKIRSYIENGIIENLPNNKQFSNVIKTDGNVYIHYSSNGYYASTPNDFLLQSEYFENLNALEVSGVIELLNDEYMLYISHKEEMQGGNTDE